MQREKTTKTTRFIIGRMCENCFNDGWSIDWSTFKDGNWLSARYRCKGCNRIVANLDGDGGYIDEEEDE